MDAAASTPIPSASRGYPLDYPGDQPAVLVVDDDPLGRAQMQYALEPAYRVIQAPSAEEALHLAGEAAPDLVLLDVAMPGLGGYGFLRRWMEKDRWRDIPVICVTGMDEPGMEQQALSLGAVDYVTKPYLIPTLLARARTHLELRSARLRLKVHAEHLEREHEMVEDIIERQRKARNFEPRHLRFVMSSAEKTTGDMLLSAMTPGGFQWVLVGDVSGHGLPAAVCTMLVSHIFYREARDGNDLAVALDRINEALCLELPTQIFMPCAAVEIVRGRPQQRLWNAGLPGCMFWPAAGALEEVPPSELPLGIERYLDFGRSARTLSAGKGDRFYFFTDGLTEFQTASGKPFGTEGTIDFLYRSHGHFSFETLLDHLRGIKGQQEFVDDITLAEVMI